MRKLLVYIIAEQDCSIHLAHLRQLIQVSLISFNMTYEKIEFSKARNCWMLVPKSDDDIKWENAGFFKKLYLLFFD